MAPLVSENCQFSHGRGATWLEGGAKVSGLRNICAGSEGIVQCCTVAECCDGQNSNQILSRLSILSIQRDMFSSYDADGALEKVSAKVERQSPVMQSKNNLLDPFILQ